MNEGVEVIWDESSAEAVAKLRAMNEAGNITWDLVDVVAADAHPPLRRRPGDGNRPDELLAPAPDGTPASEDFGDLIVSDCFIPQIVYSTTFGYRTDMVGDTPPTTSATCSTWRPIRASARWRSVRSTTWNGRCSATACQGRRL
jgi:putative spermidine/putrescine transport system substrate-binding protein